MGVRCSWPRLVGGSAQNSPMDVALQFYTDDRCVMAAGAPVPAGDCHSTGEEEGQQSPMPLPYGGARLHLSSAFRRPEITRSYREYCMVVPEGKLPQALFTPWFRYEDIDRLTGHDDDHTDDHHGPMPTQAPSLGGHGGPCIGSDVCKCVGPLCSCTGSDCMCQGPHCGCAGYSCACSAGTGQCNATSPAACFGAGCACTGPQCMCGGMQCVNATNQVNPNSLCTGTDCHCIGDLCDCYGPDCHCTGSPCTSPLSALSCFGNSCRCGNLLTSKSCGCMGIGCNCVGPMCGCDGPDCRNVSTVPPPARALRSVLN